MLILVKRIYRRLLMTVSALLCLLYFTVWSTTLTLVHDNCIYCSTPNNNLQEFHHEIDTNESISKQLINPSKIEYIYKPLNVCDLHTGPNLLLVLVKSDVFSSGHRLSIRQTWGNISNPRIKIVYLLGYNSIAQDMVDLEYKIYKDVLQGDFVDSYDNNINKTVMAYQYAVEHCVNTKFLFFVDDDFFVNILKIKMYLKTLNSPFNTKLFAGFIIKRGKPYRNKSSKWYISREEYPYDFFPTYPAGGAILMSMTIAQLLKAAFPYVRYINIDDVFLGIVAMKLKLELQNDEQFSLKYTPPMRLKNVFASHGYGDTRNLLKKWDLFLGSMYLNSSTDLNKQL